MDVSLDKDGDLALRESGISMWVEVSRNGEAVVVRAYFTLKPGLSDAAKLRFVNTLNTDYVMIRAYTFQDKMIIDYMIRADKGLVKRTVIPSVKLFAQICAAIFQKGTEAEGLIA